MCLIIWYCLLMVIQYVNVVSTIEVGITAPVNPVEVGAIFSVFCQVKGLTNKHEVALYRTIGSEEPQRLSSKENVDTEIDERVFLAVRRLIDGSEVYFLTITDFTRNDVGEYSCKVIRTSPTIAEVASDVVQADLLYFPSGSDPQCSNSGDPITIMEGAMLELNCSSEMGNPTVSIAWSRAGHEYSKGASEYSEMDRIYSILKLKVTKDNEGDIFLCEIQSYVEPFKSSCHAGPLRVIPDPNNPGSNVEHTTMISTPEKPTVNRNPTKSISSNCKEFCSSTAYVPKPWIISTIVTGVIAVVLLFIIIIVSIKYTSQTSTSNSPGTRLHRSPDEIYTELQYRKGDLVYVPAEKTKGVLDQTRTEHDAFETMPYRDS